MTEYTDDEIWAGLAKARGDVPTLFERATAAYSERKAEEIAAQRDEVLMLEAEALKLMRNVLFMTDAEMNEAKAGWRAVSHNNERMRVEFTADRWHFRVYFKAEPIKITKDGEKVIIGEELNAIYQHRPKQSSQFKAFTRLDELVEGMQVSS